MLSTADVNGAFLLQYSCNLVLHVILLVQQKPLVPDKVHLQFLALDKPHLPLYEKHQNRCDGFADLQKNLAKSPLVSKVATKKQTFAQEVRYNMCRFFILIIKGASNDTT